MPGHDVLLMDDDNTLHYAGSGESLEAFRAYFLVDPTKVSNTRLTDYVFELGNGETLSGTFPWTIQPGDANGDGMTDIADVTAIINYINNVAPPSFNAMAADVNKDGSIDIADVTAVINIINSVSQGQ